MTTKRLASGKPQAVSVPKEFQLEGAEIEIIKRGNELVLLPINKESAAAIYELLAGFKPPIQRIAQIDQERDLFADPEFVYPPIKND